MSLQHRNQSDLRMRFSEDHRRSWCLCSSLGPCRSAKCRSPMITRLSARRSTPSTIPLAQKPVLISTWCRQSPLSPKEEADATSGYICRFYAVFRLKMRPGENTSVKSGFRISHLRQKSAIRRRCASLLCLQIGEEFIQALKRGGQTPTYGIHGTLEPELIGKAGSHSCVRLTNRDAGELAAMVKPGVVVEFVD